LWSICQTQGGIDHDHTTDKAPQQEIEPEAPAQADDRDYRAEDNRYDRFETVHWRDAHPLMAELSVEELCRTAEQYFARLEHYNYHLAKPFADVNESPQL